MDLQAEIGRRVVKRFAIVLTLITVPSFVGCDDGSPPGETDVSTTPTTDLEATDPAVEDTAGTDSAPTDSAIEDPAATDSSSSDSERSDPDVEETDATDSATGDVTETTSTFAPVDPEMAGLNEVGIPAILNEYIVCGAEGTELSDVQSAVTAVSGSVVGALPVFDLYQVRFDSAEAAQGAMASLEADPNLECVVPNYLFFSASAPHYEDDVMYRGDEDSDEEPEPGGWWIDQIRLPPAWQVASGFGGSGQVVAIVDTGFETGHEELQARVAYAPAELPVDIHGTMVAGFVAANDNDRGLLGVCPYCEVSLLPLSLFPASIPDSFPELFAATLSGLAVQLGTVVRYPGRLFSPHVVNISLVFNWRKVPWVRQDDKETAVRRVQEALGGPFDIVASQGIVLVHAAGNDGIDYALYDLFGRPGVVVVGGTDRGDAPWEDSNYGDSVDICAPAVQLIAPCSGLSDYCTGDGTSFAAPQVAGAIALVMSADPSLSAYEAAQIVIDTADTIDAEPGRSIGGRLNVWKAMLAAVNGESFDESIHDNYWYGIEINGVEKDVAAVEIEDVLAHSLHLGLPNAGGKSVAYLNVQGSSLIGEAKDIEGFDVGAERLLNRMGVNFYAWTRWRDSYVYRVANTWHLALGEYDGGSCGTCCSSTSSAMVYVNEDGETANVATCSSERQTVVSGPSSCAEPATCSGCVIGLQRFLLPGGNVAAAVGDGGDVFVAFERVHYSGDCQSGEPETAIYRRSDEGVWEEITRVTMTPTQYFGAFAVSPSGDGSE